MTPGASHFVRYQLPAVVWAVVIYIASSIPSARLPKIVNLVSDKTIHVFVFFVFGLLLYRGLEPRSDDAGFSFRRALVAVAAVVVYGVADELHQSFVPGRTLDFWDMVADTAGGLAAAIVAFIWFQFVTKKRDAPVA